ncbi:MAG: hypothetical protein UY48_C0009G0021 [Candidatus Gottesmanbacteria bacterium GW2011_GWB1_49_7]|uniref:Uncharacterized protein n=1 Tax=Candidatus Gottesmanbacteria bacterium GW2011_GWB1_49_7 TaxID=1618448 RepID=A0A0G1W245_9BACT|nr:MAG: hypothetical protein UY48_C0009G0021 [Candidatus Gottesmanbacteria bacterium GW2011_GWB1_49_7]
MKINVVNSPRPHNANNPMARVLRLEWNVVDMGDIKAGDVFITLDQNNEVRGEGSHDGMWIATEEATGDSGVATVACEQLNSKFVTHIPDLDVEVVYHLPQFLPYNVYAWPESSKECVELENN